MERQGERRERKKSVRERGRKKGRGKTEREREREEREETGAWKEKVMTEDRETSQAFPLSRNTSGPNKIKFQPNRRI